jgi:hypothetical protein
LPRLSSCLAKRQRWVAVIWCVCDELCGGGVVRCTVMKEVPLGRGRCLACAFSGLMAGTRGGRVYLLELQSLFPFIIGGPVVWCCCWFRWWSFQIGAGRLVCHGVTSDEGGHVGCSECQAKAMPDFMPMSATTAPSVSFTSVGALLRFSGATFRGHQGENPIPVIQMSGDDIRMSCSPWRRCLGGLQSCSGGGQLEWLSSWSPCWGVVLSLSLSLSQKLFGPGFSLVA